MCGRGTAARSVLMTAANCESVLHDGTLLLMEQDTLRAHPAPVLGVVRWG